ncbi:MAG: DUF4258 domain-containing protein [Chloroflexi bacterium]|nr:DUF4258 domain-containing protein [Chloroflexota bacterium]
MAEGGGVERLASSIEMQYTYHALSRMRLRRVSEEMVEEAISTPDRMSRGYGRRQLAFKAFPNRGTLKVVFARIDDRVVIVTVIWE